jgi:hypothetical protein
VSSNGILDGAVIIDQSERVELASICDERRCLCDGPTAGPSSAVFSLFFTTGTSCTPGSKLITDVRNQATERKLPLFLLLNATSSAKFNAAEPFVQM